MARARRERAADEAVLGGELTCFYCGCRALSGSLSLLCAGLWAGDWARSPSDVFPVERVARRNYEVALQVRIVKRSQPRWRRSSVRVGR